MTSKTATNLTKLNLDFYQKTFPIWNPNLDYEWPGFSKIKEIFKQKIDDTEFSVLDLGSGNSRFLYFLQKTFNQKFNYQALDFEPEIIQKAKLFFSQPESQQKQKINFSVVNLLDLDTWNLGQNKFDFIVLFGLIHHIPGHLNRLRILTNSARFLKENGILIFTTWEFLNEERLRKRIVDLSSVSGQEILQKFEILKEDLEPGDHILDWNKKVQTYRYSHAFTTSEITDLIEISGLRLIENFSSDGRFENRNNYYICKSL